MKCKCPSHNCEEEAVAGDWCTTCKLAAEIQYHLG